MESRCGFIVQWYITDKCNLQCTHCYRTEEIEPHPQYWYEPEVS